MKLLFGLLFTTTLGLQAQTLIHKVNPFIGTGGHGHTYPGATAPFGMVQLSPDTRLDGWDGCSGYHYDDSICYGFSHTHLSGTGVSDYGDLLVRPGIKPLTFQHKNETAHPGYYAVTFNNSVFAEMTAGTREGMHHYRFPAGQKPVIVIDLEHRDYVLDGHIQIEKNRISGHRISKAWAEEQHFYFHLTTSATPDSVAILKTKNSQTRAVALYFAQGNQDVYIAANISFASPPVSQNPNPGPQSFENLKKQTQAAWEKQLGKIVVNGTAEQESIFYTALYHTMIVPNIVSDANGNYLGMDKKQHAGKGDHYSVFSLWDTYRATHPLYTLIEQQRTLDFMKTFLRMYRQSGRLPVWELASNETNCMIGYHAVSVIADAMAKGIISDSAVALLEAAVKTAEKPVFGLDDYMKYGFLSMENESESVSKTLEYAYNDWCIARMAEMLGKDSIAKVFYRRCGSWVNVFDPKSGHMRPRTYGRWLSPFEPKEVNNHYTEANSWQYSFSVPHDLQDWLGAMINHGPHTLESMLDSLFTTTSKTVGREQADITGLIGQYAHGNEPSHHIAYLYNSAGKPHKTQEKVRQILETLYHNKPDGLSGNEDCGQMSAWYVLSSMGFYPVCPGDDRYSIGYPLFQKSQLSFENGKQLQILKKGKGHYIAAVMLNGIAVERNYLFQRELTDGGKLVFTMASKPIKWATGDKNGFFTNVKESSTAAPLFNFSNIAFDDSMAVNINARFGRDFTVRFFQDNQEKSRMIVHGIDPYKAADTTLILKASVCLEAFHPGGAIARACFFKKPNQWKVTILNPLHLQYTGGGNQALCDGVRGDAEWQKGNWQGIQGQPYEAIIDLGDTQTITSLHAGFLQDTRSWIVYPRNVSYMFSLDGKTWSNACGTMNNIPIDSLGSQKQTISTYTKPIKSRYVKIRAAQHGTLPEWHPGAGGETFIFVDELEVR
jgi:predicted alpha-1,2-mannosidase